MPAPTTAMSQRLRAAHSVGPLATARTPSRIPDSGSWIRATASARECASILRNADARWVLTVLSARKSLPRDLAVRHAEHEQREDLLLAVRERARGDLPAEHDRDGELAGEQGVGGGHERALDVVLEDDPGRAGEQHASQGGVREVGGHDGQDRRVRMRLGERADRAQVRVFTSRPEQDDQRVRRRLGLDAEAGVAEQPDDVAAPARVASHDRGEHRRPHRTGLGGGGRRASWCSNALSRASAFREQVWARPSRWSCGCARIATSPAIGGSWPCS